MAFIEPMHRNKPNITYLLTWHFLFQTHEYWVSWKLNHQLTKQIFCKIAWHGVIWTHKTCRKVNCVLAAVNTWSTIGPMGMIIHTEVGKVNPIHNCKVDKIIDIWMVIAVFVITIGKCSQWFYIMIYTAHLATTLLLFEKQSNNIAACIPNTVSFYGNFVWYHWRWVYMHIEIKMKFRRNRAHASWLSIVIHPGIYLALK